jgi:hypothetical protein
MAVTSCRNPAHVGQLVEERLDIALADDDDRIIIGPAPLSDNQIAVWVEIHGSIFLTAQDDGIARIRPIEFRVLVSRRC